MARAAAEPSPGSDPDRGAIVLDDYPDVSEERAGRRTRAIYADIRRSLRLPFVAEPFRALAGDVEFLEAAWENVGPFVRTQRFERAADRLRRRAVLRPMPSAVDLAEDLREVRGERLGDFNATVHYGLPKVMLACQLIDHALVRTARQGTKTPPRADLPSGAAPGTVDVQPLQASRLRGARRDLLEEIRSYHGHPRIDDYFAVLAGWPSVLDSVWRALKPTVATGRYVDRRRALAEEAHRLTVRYPLRGISPESVGLDDEGLQDVRDLLSLYRVRVLPHLLIDATMVKALLDGPRAAARSAFSLTRRRRRGERTVPMPRARSRGRRTRRMVSERVRTRATD